MDSWATSFWVEENGWYALTPASEGNLLRSWPFGRLKEVWSCLVCCFWIAGIAPLLISFLATSRASLASAGLFRDIGFSGSCFGAFRACSAFFWNGFSFIFWKSKCLMKVIEPFSLAFGICFEASTLLLSNFEENVCKPLLVIRRSLRKIFWIFLFWLTKQIHVLLLVTKRNQMVSVNFFCREKSE